MTLLAPFISSYCSPTPTENPSLNNEKYVKISPIGMYVEKSASLAEMLADSEISAPTRMMEAKMAITDLIPVLQYSDVEPPMKQQLLHHLNNMRRSIQDVTTKITTMVAAFNEALENLKMYIEYTLTHLTYVQSSPNLSTFDGQQDLQKSFSTYLTSINDEVNRVLFKTQDVSQDLKDIDESLYTINDLLRRHQAVTRNDLDKLEHGSYLATLYRMTVGNGRIDQVKYKRNIITLDNFAHFTQHLSANTNNIILKLSEFTSEADQLKETVALVSLQTIPIEVHTELLRKAIKRLDTSKETFRGRKRLDYKA
ncbi:unnamed protein product [Didymodactylos carnosus]|uniref:Uncharacterized protein n=2 Tax=Didymodactylos carnosus TaxID=1234261 RepID=A0A8S2CPU3_9BILA|nr:unnamed protein product [Didymodactylos carnosus]CAF3553744.1 unnamed protein product [Didymodactylos carnosus]